MAEPELLPKTLKEQRKKIPPMVEKLRANGFKVLVDETSGILAAAAGAHHVSLKTRHSDGRAALIVGIERFNELVLQKAISFPQKNPGSYEIPASIVDIEFNASGEEVYRVNWRDIRIEHVLTILCCYSTVYQPVASADYIAAMTGMNNDDNQPNRLLRAFHSIVRHHSAQSAEEANNSTLTGKRLSENEVIL